MIQHALMDYFPFLYCFTALAALRFGPCALALTDGFHAMTLAVLVLAGLALLFGLVAVRALTAPDGDGLTGAVFAALALTSALTAMLAASP